MRKMVRPKIVALAVTLPLFLAACTAGPLTGVDSSAPSATATAAAVNTVSPQPSSAGSSNDPLDNGGYAEYTWDDYVKSAQKMSGLNSWPEVERIRYVTEEEWANVKAKCLTDLGFPSTVESDGSVQTLSVSDQDEALAEASYTCSIQYPKDLRYAQAFTRTQLRIIYAYFRDELIPCLQNLGLETGQQPSEETYVEGIVTGTAEWTPYDDANIDAIDVKARESDCPSMPPSEVLYGS
ncbi:hypothetical protein [Arthrobacter sp. MYb227]|uniref:hypothetical protein n=1 Tax=Arthrobacter sp. MYb227 TaxID=1848601 RepID=UPI0015E36E06|nr:hypothetical protein [Arthrobacter sp. MYb227]